MDVEANCARPPSAKNGSALVVDGIEPAPKEPIEALLLRSIEGCAIYALDRAGHVLTWHPGAERIKGYLAAEIVGRHFSVFYSGEARACRSPDRDLLAASKGPIERAGWRVRKDGSWFWAHTVVTPMYDRDGCLVGFGCVVVDLTKGREAEEARLRRAIAEVSGRLRDGFFRQARRALDNALLGARLHLDSLHAAVRHESIDVKSELATRVTLLEWAHRQLADAIDRSLNIVSDTKAKLETDPLVGSEALRLVDATIGARDPER